MNINMVAQGMSGAPGGGAKPVAPASAGKTGEPRAASAPSVAPRPVQTETPAPEIQTQKTRTSPEELARVTEALRSKVSSVAPELQFSIDESSGRSVIRITDPATKEVIRQIPSEDILKLNRAMDQFEKGLLLNRKA